LFIVVAFEPSKLFSLPKFALSAVAAGAIIAVSLCSCSSTAFKPPPAEISSFLAKEPSLKPDRKHSPFALDGGSAITSLPGIYIAPVTLSCLRCASKYLAKGKNSEPSRQKAACELADYARQQFIKAFEKSPKPHYVVQNSPGPNCIQLELAMTELNRNTIPGSFARFAMNVVAVPGTDAILAKATRGMKGNIAIEGKVTDCHTGKIIYQFADNEESKSALLLPITDFETYGQARDAIRDWAKEFEEVTRRTEGQCVKGSSVVSLF
jgi:hypothetical protein